MTGNLNVNGAKRCYIPSQCYQNMYANNALFAGEESLMGLAPVGGNYSMSYNNSIMSSPFQCQMGNMAGMGYGMGQSMGYGPGSEVMNMSQADLMRYQESLENQQIDKDVRQKKKLKQAEFNANSSEDLLTRSIAILQAKVKANELDHIMPEYRKLVETVKQTLAANGVSDVSEEKARAYAEKLYTAKAGKSLIEDIEENGDSGFVQGLKQGAFGAGWLVTNRKTKDEVIAEITGTEPDKASTAMAWVGRGTSLLLTGALALFGGARLIKSFGKKPTGTPAPAAAAAATP